MNETPSADAPRAVVHIGLHKTGTTAFQETLDEATPDLAALGVRVMRYDGPLFPGTPRSTSFDLLNAVVRTDCDAWFRLLEPTSLLGSVQRASAEAVRAQAAGPEPLLIASHEGLSLVRTADEVRRLVELLQPRDVHVVLVRREVEAYLRSLRLQLQRFRLSVATPHPDSCLDLRPGSWMSDIDGLVAVYASVLGHDQVTVLDYDDSIRAERSIVPALWRACGLPTVTRLGPLADRAWTNLTPEASATERAWRADLDASDDPSYLRDQAVAARRELAGVLASPSWRLTAPLRRAKHWWLGRRR